MFAPRPDSSGHTRGARPSASRASALDGRAGSRPRPFRADSVHGRLRPAGAIPSAWSCLFWRLRLLTASWT